MAETDRYILRLEAQVADLKRDLRKGEKHVDRFSSRAKRSLGSIKKAVGPLAAGIAAAFSVRAIGNFITSAVEAGDAIAKTADKIGMSTDALQQWRYIAERQGAAVEMLDSSLERFVKRIGETAQGTSMAAATIEDLGIEIRDSNDRIRPTEDLLLDVAGAINNLDTQAEKAAAAADLFGREGVALINAFRGGDEQIKAFMDELERIGGIVDRETLDKLQEFADEITKMKTAMKAQKIEISANFLPLMEAWNTSVLWLSRQYDKWNDSNEKFIQNLRNQKALAEDIGPRFGFLDAQVRAYLRTQVQAAEEEEAAAAAAEKAAAARKRAFVSTTQALAPLKSSVEELQRIADSDLTMTPAEEGESPADAFQLEMTRMDRALQSFSGSAKAAWGQMWESMAQQDMTGAERFKALQNAMLQGFLRLVSEMVLAWILGEQMKTASSEAGTAARVALALEGIVAKLAEGAAAIASAIASVWSWLLATLGPFGIGIAAALTAGIIASWGAIKSMLGFAEGGLLRPEQGPGFFEAQRPEIIAPQEDFMRVASSLLGMSEQQLGQGAVAGGGGDINISIQAWDGRDVERVVRREVVPVLQRERYRGRRV